MFTSRAEFRLSVRAENADVRLTRRAYEAGFVSKDRYEIFCERERHISDGMSQLSSFILPSAKWTALGHKVSEDGRPRSAADILSSPHVTLPDILALMRAHGCPEAGVHPRVADNVEVSVKYKGYLERQAREVAEFKAGASVAIPADLVYTDLPGLSKEEQEILTAHRPVTVHAASRIPGIRPSTLLLLFQVAKRQLKAADALAAAGTLHPAGAAAQAAAAAAEAAGLGGSSKTKAALLQARQQAAILRAEAEALAEERKREGSLAAGAM